MRNFFARIWAWILSWFVRPIHPLKTLFVEELPEFLNPKAIYVIGEGSHRWFVAMACPCGCHATLEVSLLHEAIPRWTLIEHSNGTISLNPSIWRTVGCRSHFFLQQGKIKWCSDYVA